MASNNNIVPSPSSPPLETSNVSSSRPKSSPFELLPTELTLSIISALSNPIDKLHLRTVSPVFWNLIPFSFSGLCCDQKVAAYPLLVNDLKITQRQRVMLELLKREAGTEIGRRELLARWMEQREEMIEKWVGRVKGI